MTELEDFLNYYCSEESQEEDLLTQVSNYLVEAIQSLHTLF